MEYGASSVVVNRYQSAGPVDGGEHFDVMNAAVAAFETRRKAKGASVAETTLSQPRLGAAVVRHRFVLRGGRLGGSGCRMVLSGSIVPVYAL
jgi:hypothetical protein